MSGRDGHGAAGCVATVIVSLVVSLCAWPGPVTGHATGVRSGRALSSGTASALVRTVRVGQHPVLMAVDARDHHVFVASAGRLAGDFVLPSGPGSVSMVDERTGAVLRTVAVGRSPVAIAVDAPTGRVFVLSAGAINTVAGPVSVGGSVAVLDAATGAPLRTVAVDPVPVTLSSAGAGPTARQALVVDPTRGRVYAVVSTGVLVLDGATGLVRRQIELDGPPSVAALDAADGLLYVGDADDPTLPTPPLPEGGYVGFLTALDLATGRARANPLLKQQGVGAIAVDTRAGRVLVVEPHGVSERAFVDVFAARTGAHLRRITLPGAFGQGDCVVALDGARGRAFVLYTPSGYDAQNGFGATLYVLDTTSGSVLQATPLASGGGGYFLGRAVAVVAPPARVLVATASGGLSEPPGSVAVSSSDVAVFDAPSLRSLAPLPVGGGPQDVAIDEQAQRVFITNEHDNTLSVFDARRL